MKKTLKVLLVAVLALAMFASFAYAEDSVNVHHEENNLGAFVDAPAEDSWKFQGLNCAVENGVMNGHENKLRPDDSLTRAEMVTMMVRVLGADVNKADIEHYIDVAMGEWYYEALQSGVAAKLINGSGNQMMPNAAITREQTFTILARAFLHMESDKGAANKFSDAGAISDWAKSATNALVESGVVQGDASNTLRPKANVTRAEFAAMLDRIACYMAKGDSDYAGKKIEGSVILKDANANLDGAVIDGDLYITDAVDSVDLTNVTVTGRIVVRGSEVNLGAGTSASQVVVGNPTGNAAVKADESVKVEKVVVAENSNDVELDVPADEVVINSAESEVTIKSDAEKVTVAGSDNTVKVEEGAKVDNMVVDGEGTKVAGSGKVENAVINGADSKVETPDTNVTDNTPVVTPPSGDDNKPSGDDNKSDANDTPNSSTVPSKPNKEEKISDAYITYGDGEQVDGTIAGNTVTFDLSELDDAVELDAVYVGTGSTKNCVSSLATFTSNEEVSVADIIAQVIDNTNDQLVQIDGSETFSIYVLKELVYDAYSFYELRDVNEDYLFRDLFTAKGIAIEVIEGELKFKSTFTGKIGNDNFTLVIITEIPAQ